MKLRGARHGRRLLALCLAIDSGVLLWFALSTPGDPFTYAHTVDEVLEASAGTPWLAKRLSIPGEIVPGSLQVTEPCRVTFELRGTNGASLRVRRANCAKPFALCLAGAGLRFEGYLVREGEKRVLLAQRSTLSCPSKYDVSQTHAAYDAACAKQPLIVRRLCPWC